MNEHFLFTQSRARLCLKASRPGVYNWLFLPGGPGLGSESLFELINIISVPGNSWALDLPGDGSNTTEDDVKFFAQWSKALEEAASALPNVILVAHSSGGMFALATPSLEKIIKGLVLMDSAPDASWQDCFMQYVKERSLVEANRLQKIYDRSPSNENLKSLTIACHPYFSTDQSAKQIIHLLESLPFNYKTHQWAAEHFDNTYKAKWIPKILPTLIFAGDKDRITPIELFSKIQAFQRSNILIRIIYDAAHFPWYEKPKEVKEAFEEFYATFLRDI